MATRRVEDVTEDTFRQGSTEEKEHYLFNKMLDDNQIVSEAVNDIHTTLGNMETKIGAMALAQNSWANTLTEARALFKQANETVNAERARGGNAAGCGDIRVNAKQPRVAAPVVFNGDPEKVDQLLADC